MELRPAEAERHLGVRQPISGQPFSHGCFFRAFVFGDLPPARWLIREDSGVGRLPIASDPSDLRLPWRSICEAAHLLSSSTAHLSRTAACRACGGRRSSWRGPLPNAVFRDVPFAEWPPCVLAASSPCGQRQSSPDGPRRLLNHVTSHVLYACCAQRPPIEFAESRRESPSVGSLTPSVLRHLVTVVWETPQAC